MHRPHVQNSEIRELVDAIQLIDEVIRNPQLAQRGCDIIQAFELLDAIATQRQDFNCVEALEARNLLYTI